jgi:hypothetical protein
MDGDGAAGEAAPGQPEYTIVHCSAQDHTQGEEWSEPMGQPDEIMVRVKLPRVESAAQVELDVQAESMQLGVAGKYALSLDFPYRVNDAEGSARFDKQAQQMEIRLPVVGRTEKRKRPILSTSAPASRATAEQMIKQLEMDDKTLYRDFVFLEGAQRQSDASKRQRTQWPAHYTNGGRGFGRGGGRGRGRGGRGRGRDNSATPAPEVELPKKIALVRAQARERGTEVLVLAAGMLKRTRNTSFYNVKLKTLAWRVDWIFKREDGERAMIADERVSEDRTLTEALGMHVGPEQLARPSTAAQRLQLRKYVAQFRADPSAIRYLLKIEVGTSGVSGCYKELNGAVALKEALKGVVLVEYPVVYVVLPSDSEKYNTKDWVLPERLLPGPNGINSWAELVAQEGAGDDSDDSDSSESDTSDSSDDDDDDDDERGAEHGNDDGEAGTGTSNVDQIPVAPEDLPENWF